jgi:hypothetical protein
MQSAGGGELTNSGPVFLAIDPTSDASVAAAALVNAADPGFTGTDFNNNRGTQTVTEGTDAIVRLATLPKGVQPARSRIVMAPCRGDAQARPQLITMTAELRAAATASTMGLVRLSVWSARRTQAAERFKCR